MKLYRCADGTRINPTNVTHARKYKEENKFVVKFAFIGGVGREILFDRNADAELEIEAYEEHCEKYA
ncbi:hypothetical protein [Sansalvadorimonas verongulae]|uniref:hypothetical protein n=1 Tax=Sansalvadorimonas verongulae TaxID=2172824 RepID=UPI0012BC3F89|nr:hypothetical protein [Sansalvadorimonas verongulae]MTI12824.1 hypothetical protein [Sansalvadorimonas verongulae]